MRIDSRIRALEEAVDPHDEHAERMAMYAENQRLLELIANAPDPEGRVRKSIQERAEWNAKHVVFNRGRVVRQPQERRMIRPPSTAEVREMVRELYAERGLECPLN